MKTDIIFVNYKNLLGLLLAFILLGCIKKEDEPVRKASPLVAPYELAVPEASVKPASSLSPCKNMPSEPIKDLVLSYVYKRNDPYRADIDEEGKTQYTKETRSLYKFETELLEMSNNYLRTGNQSDAACALNWLYQWAVADALLGETNSQGVYVRQWSLASLSSAYLQIRSYAELKPRKSQIVEVWLSRVAKRVVSEYADESESKLNNHLYWAAWAVANTGVALNDRDLYDWGITKAKYALVVQVKDDGTLPLELARGKKALHYHVFALAPLIMISETGIRNGENLYLVRNGVLHSLIEHVFAGMQNHEIFKEITGFPQDSVLDISPGHFSWVEVYSSRFNHQSMESWIRSYRPVFSRRTGGNVTFLYSPQRNQPSLPDSKIEAVSGNN